MRSVVILLLLSGCASLPVVQVPSGHSVTSAERAAEDWAFWEEFDRLKNKPTGWPFR